MNELERLARLPEIPQSFLFSGPRHVGKRLVAEWFAELLIEATAQGGLEQNLYVLEPSQVVSAKRTREQVIPVESIREVQKFLSLSPISGKRRVLLIDGAEKLGHGAANALLKFLEEPPERSILILITAEPASLPQTLLSRLLAFHFTPVPGDVIRQALPEGATLPPFFIDLGLPGVIKEAVDFSDGFMLKKNLLRSLFQLSKLSLQERMTLAETLSKDESMARDILEIWCTGLVFQARAKETARVAQYTFLEQILATLRSLSRGEGALRPLLEKLFFSV